MSATRVKRALGRTLWLGFCLLAAWLWLPLQAARAQSVSANGSRIADSSRNPLAAIDTSYTLTSSCAPLIIYAAGLNDFNCRLRAGEGGHSPQYRVLAGSWANIPTSNGSGPYLEATATVLVNNSLVTDSERLANTSGNGSFVVAAREFKSSTNLEYAADPVEVRNDHTETQWALNFSTSPDSTTYQFRVRWATKDCGNEYITYSAQITTPSSTLHFSISHDSTAVNCQAENVTISAHDSGHVVDTSYAGTITLSTSTSHGDWSLVTGSGTLTNSGNGSATYAFDAGDSGVVVLGLRNTFTETTNINVTDGSASELSCLGEDANLVYASAGFIFLADATKNTIGTQIGGKASNVAPGVQTLELQAVRTSDDTGACEAALTGANTIELAFECETPTTCTARQVSIIGTDIAGNPNGSVSSYTNVSLDFGDSTDTTATYTFSYPDVGQLQLHARYTLSPSGEHLLGTSNSFVVRPFAFDVSVTGNPGATGETGTIFTTAGTSFTASAEAVLWSAADDADNDGVADNHDDTNPANNADLTDNTAALNYGQESSTENVALAAVLFAPSGGNDPGLQGGTSITSFSSGSGSSTTAYYDEVGIVELNAAVSDGNYLGIGTTDTNKIVGRSGHVGRFTPFDFSIAQNSPSFTPACAAGAYTYIGQTVDYGVAPVLTITARSSQTTTTQNYTGVWWKVTNTSLTGRSYSAATGTLDTTGLPATSGDPTIVDSADGTGTLTFAGGTGLLFTRSGPVTPFDADIALAINVIDTDTIAYSSNPATFGVATAGNGIAFTGSKVMRWGRIVLENAHGPELSALPVPFRAEYYDGLGFITHTSDSGSCSSIVTGDLGLTYTPGGLSSPTIANSPLLLGDAGLSFSAPGVGNTGTVDITGDLTAATGADLEFLLYDWDDDGGYDDNPTGTATFGIFTGEAPIIFIREVY